MDPMYLREVEEHAGGGPWAEAIRRMREAGLPVPQIMHLFAFKPERTSLEHSRHTSPEHFTKKFWRSEHSIVASRQYKREC